MSNGSGVADEIRKLIESGNIDGADADRLQLAAMAEILTRMNEIEARIERLEKFRDEYRPLTWYWQHRRKEVIAAIIGLMMFYTFFFSPVNISDFRQVILEWLNFPVVTP